MAERPSVARPSLGERKLTLRDLNVDADSDAESISVDGAGNDPLVNRVDDDYVPSDSDAADHDDGAIPGTSAHERFVVNLEAQGIRENIDTSDMEEFHRRLSEISFSDKSYIMDLGRQQAAREETIRKEAFEDAHIWYGKALIRGMPESKELFANIYTQLIEETRGRYTEFHKKQDEWLNQALDEYQQKMSAEELEKIQKKAPTDDDLKKQKLAKKISKTEKLMKKALKNEGKDSETYRNYEKKLAEYRAQSGEHEDSETKPKRKSKEKNGIKTRKSKPPKDDASTRRKKSKDKKLKPKKSSSKKLFDDNDDVSKAQSTMSLRTGKKRNKEKKEKRGSKKSASFRSSRSIVSMGGEPKRPSSSKTLKKKTEKPPKPKSLPNNIQTDSE